MGTAAGRVGCTCGQPLGHAEGDGECPPTCIRSDFEVSSASLTGERRGLLDEGSFREAPPPFPVEPIEQLTLDQLHTTGVIEVDPADTRPTFSAKPPDSLDASPEAADISTQAAELSAQQMPAPCEEQLASSTQEVLPDTEGVTKQLSQTTPASTTGAAAAATKKPRKPKAEKEAKEPKESREEKAKKKEYKKKSYLQKVKDRKAYVESQKEKMSVLVDDIIAGKYRKEGGGQPGGNMLIKMPAPVDRLNTRKLVLGQFRAQYKKIGRSDNCPSANGTVSSAPATTQYSASETQALQIVGGHQPLVRPENVQLPKDFRKPVGPMTLQKLCNYGNDSNRKLVSVYGDIFDVSDRPDKYGVDGLYSWMTGNDITWGFVSGKDVPETVNKCYDLWKVAPDHFRDSKLRLIYAWVAFYEYEYGDAVGKLDLYENEAALKGPPMEESEDCCIM